MSEEASVAVRELVDVKSQLGTTEIDLESTKIELDQTKIEFEAAKNILKDLQVENNKENMETSFLTKSLNTIFFREKRPLASMSIKAPSPTFSRKTWYNPSSYLPAPSPLPQRLSRIDGLIYIDISID